MTTQTMLSISVDGLKVYRAILLEAAGALTHPPLQRFQQTNHARLKIASVVDMLTVDIKAAESPEVLAGDAHVTVTVEEDTS